MLDTIDFLGRLKLGPKQKNPDYTYNRNWKKKKRALKAASKFLLFLSIVETSKKRAFKSA